MKTSMSLLKEFRKTSRGRWTRLAAVVALAAGLSQAVTAASAEPARAKGAARPSAAEAEKPAGEQPRAVELKEDRPTPAVLDVEGKAIALFRIEVPKDAVLMTVRVLDSPILLDILARIDKPIASAKDAEYRSNADVMDPALRISRQSLPALEDGTWYIGVTYLDQAPAVVHKRPVKSIPFSVKVSFVRTKTQAVLELGHRTAGRLSAEEGSMCSFAVDVPVGAKALRIDLDDVASDLDILARHAAPLVANEDAEATAISPLGRESLVIDKASPTPLVPGRWYINVVHPAGFGAVNFAIYASTSPDPPAALLAIPPLGCPTDPRQRAIAATVDVSTEITGASGTLLSDDGLVLTNYHVIAEFAEGAAEKAPIVVAVTIDPHESPRELFRGRVVVFDRDRDLALIQITHGLYYQPLPKGYRFPTMPLGDSATLEIGDPLWILGFPSIGGTTGRFSVTLTEGVLGGFEKTPAGTLMKSDANISPGNSGGAVLDRRWRLVGVPTFENVSPEAVSHMSYVHPISMIPEAWRKMIAEKRPL
jgi:S1-C subfamily serine protease